MVFAFALDLSPCFAKRFKSETLYERVCDISGTLLDGFEWFTGDSEYASLALAQRKLAQFLESGFVHNFSPLPVQSGGGPPYSKTLTRG